jgi:hypothetical protein
MAKRQLKPFTIIHNLEKLTDEERAAYLAKVSEFMGLPPEMNALDMLWIPDEETGLKKYVPYARKGTTDILREIHGIKVLSMEQHDGPGYVSFKATGVNPDGRQEVAIGAHGTEGLRGEKLAAAVMTSETRAGRRLTLKFVGAGILDESETGAVTGNIAVSGASLAQLAGSSVVVPPMPGAPSAATGRDITESVPKVPQDSPVSAPEAPQTAFSEQMEAMRQDAQKQLQEKAAKIADTKLVETSVTPTDTPVTLVPEPAKVPAKRGRPRKKAGTVSFGDAQIAPAAPAPPARMVDTPALCMSCGTPLKNHDYEEGGGGYVCRPADLTKVSLSPETASAVVPATGEAQPETPAALKVSEPPATVIREERAGGTGRGSVSPLAEAIKASMFSPDPPFIVPLRPPQANPVSPSVDNQESQQSTTSAAAAIEPAKLKEFRERLRQYSNVILPKMGGMLPSEDIGGAPNKLRAFALKYTSGTEVEKLTPVQWESLFDFLDSNQNDPKGLVKYIDEAIGAK